MLEITVVGRSGELDKGRIDCGKSSVPSLNGAVRVKLSRCAGCYHIEP